MSGVSAAERTSFALAMGLVFGAIASATAPAATVNVLWEYKTRGPLTAAVLAIVALDDALALVLYRGAATGARAFIGTGESSAWFSTFLLFAEIIGAVVLGFVAGVLLYWLLKFVRADDKILGFAISTLLIVVGVTIIPGIDPILPAMVFGITLANLAPRQSKSTFSLVEKFSPPVYTSFFVLAGAHMEFAHLDRWLIAMIVIYVICRAAGKMAGSWLGAHWSNAAPTVRKYLGLCLLPQAGVAIGLAILASSQFDGELGQVIIMTVMTGTFLMEIFGPMLVKVGVRKAGEVGLNITEEDLIKSYQVEDVMERNPTVIDLGLTLPEILEIFGRSTSVFYPVVDKQHNLTGIVTIMGIKDMFANRDVAGWLLAMDVAESIQDKTYAHIPLDEVFDHMRRYDIDHIPVVESPANDRLVGVLDYPLAMRNISAEVLNRRKTADGLVLGF
jgi:Kef-type K+ transport system membrane component KefB